MKRLIIVNRAILCMLTMSGALALAQPPTDLMGMWPMDEGAGTVANDASGHANAGTLMGATWTAGKVNGALSFNGTSNRVTVPNSTSLNTITNRMTFACWVYPTNLSGDWRTIVQRANASNSWFDWQIYATASDAPTPGRPVFRVDWNSDGSIQSDEQVQGDIALTTNTWYFIACTYDGTAMRFYVDGTLRGTTAKTSGTIPNGGRSIWFGGNEPWGEYYAGKIDEISLYNRALSQAEIQTLMNSGVPSTTIVPAGSAWKYLDNGSNQGTAWRAVGFNDASWASGPARLGYGGDGEVTTVGYGPDPNNKYVTTYFRHTFTVTNPSQYPGLNLGIIRDDGAIVYLNGVEVFRTNMPGDPITSTTLASAVVSGADELSFFTTPVSPSLLQVGTNVLAVEIHQCGPAPVTSSDMGLDLKLEGTSAVTYTLNVNVTGNGSVTKNPNKSQYDPNEIVQLTAVPASGWDFQSWSGDLSGSANPTSITMTGNKTVTATFIVSTGQYTLGVNSIGSGVVTRSPDKALYNSGEVVTLTATPAVGWTLDSWSGSLTGNTNPTTITMNGNKSVTGNFAQQPGTQSVTFAAVGDYGDNSTNEANVAALIKRLNPGLIVTTGDNNYNGGTQWDNVVGRHFGQYIRYPAGSPSAYAPGPTTNAFYPSYGNHDVDLGFPSQENYFELPGNERYYTFTVGPVQFFAIDSDPREPDGITNTSTQALWLQAQLAASTAPWKVVYMHHPPFSSGSVHGSTPALQWPYENWGADAIFSGHDHVYERIHRDDNADGRVLPYFITGAGGHNLYGFVTPVTGSQVRYSANYGTMIVEANSASITFKFYSIDGTGTLIDTYTMTKPGTAYFEDFNGFTPGQTIGNFPGWYDAGGGPVVTAGNGVASSVGLAPAANIFTWSAHPFNWNDANFQKYIVQMDFQSDGSGNFDDDRIGWMTTTADVNSDNFFGVQLDPVGSSGPGQNIETYWRNGSAARIEQTIVTLPTISPNTWYRFRAEITKLTATSANIDVTLTQLDASGNPGAVVATGSVANTASLGADAPRATYFNPSAVYPAFKNFTSAGAPADNAYVQLMTGTPPTQYTLSVGVAGSGSVTKSPDKATYSEGEVVQLTAVPGSGSAFSAWSGDLTGNTNPTTIVMNGNKSVIANFIVTADITLTASEDNWLRGSQPTQNFGGAATLQTNPNGGNSQFALLKWDLSSIPANATITSASLTFYVTDISPNTFYLYDLIRSWVEGTGDATPSTTSSNWNTYDGVNTWGTGGAQNTTSDRHNTNLWGAGATTFTSTGDVTVPLNASGVAVVQGWYNTPASNYGLTVQNPATSSDYLYIASSEATNAAQRPRLNITYTVPTGPTITTSGTLTAFSSQPGVASVEQTYTVSGSNLTADISVTAPGGFEISTSSGSGFSSSVTLTQSGGSVPTTTIYVRLNSATEGSFSGNITHSSSGATTKNVAASGTVLYVYTLTAGNDGHGTVTLNPAGGSYNNGTTITLTPVPNSGYVFSSWSGANAGEIINISGVYTIVMNGNKSVTANFGPLMTSWMAYNDCVYRSSDQYIGANVTQFGIGSGFSGSTSGLLLNQTTGVSTGVTVTITQNGGVNWQPDPATGGHDPNTGTDAYTTFHGIADMTGVVYYGPAAGWYVDLTFTGLDPAKDYTFATSAARCNATYTNRLTIFTVNGADACTNASTSGVVALGPNEVQFNTGDNNAQGYVARWTNIRSGADGSFSVRARHDPSAESGYKAYAFSVFMLQELAGAVNLPPEQATLIAPLNGSTGVTTSPTLQVSVSDPEADAMTVSFYGRVKQTAGADFTVVALPDAQNYTAVLGGGTMAMFTAQTNWCVTFKVARNIVFAAMEGDITNNNSDAEWQNANTAMSILENPSPGIPYGIALGNHDGAPSTTTLYNTYFGYSRFNGRAYYGGRYGTTDNNNSYQIFSASGMDFIVIHLGYGDQTPPAGVLTWADGLLKTNSTRRGIVVSHSIIGTGTNALFSAPGQAIFDELKDNPNLFLMLCGHVHGEGRRTDTGTNGNVIHTVLSDYQNDTGGNGWLRIFTFSPVTDQITVESYSPHLGQSNWGAAPYTLSYPMESGASYTLVGTNTGVASGTTTSFTWPLLSNATEYEWYVTASDGHTTTTGETWTFTTEAAPTGHTITATAGANGSISPSGAVVVADGANQLFTITPATGYQVATLGIDNVAVAPATSYTFTNVTANHTIEATFSLAGVPVNTVGRVYNFDTNGEPLTAEITMTFSTLPAGGGTVSVTAFPVAPPSPPENVIPYYWEITSTLTNHTFNATISIDMTGVPDFVPGTSYLMYYNSTSASWVLMSGTYVAPWFTFTTDHFTPYTFMNPPSVPKDLFISASAASPPAGVIYPNTDWGVTAYDPNDWPWSGSQSISVYVVPQSGSVFGACDITLEWTGSNIAFGSVDFGTPGTSGDPNGLFAPAQGYPTQRTYSQMGTTNRLRINASRMDLTNFTTTPGDYIVRVNLTVTKPGHSDISIIATDVRAWNQGSAPSAVYVVPFKGDVKVYLGDIASASPVVSSGDGRINYDDLSPWSIAYWSGTPGYGLGAYKLKYDIGPTQDNTVFSLPIPDTKIDFEDLVIFSLSYGLSTTNQLPKLPAIPKEPVEVSLGKPMVVGNETRIPLLVEGAVLDVRALSFEITGQFDSFLGVGIGALLEDYTAPVALMSKSEGRTVSVDLAIMGLESRGIERSGEVAVLRFQGTPHVQLRLNGARSSGNTTLALKKKIGEGESQPTTYSLSQNYPNPFNPSTTIEYQLPEAGQVRLDVFSVLGEKVATLVNEVQDAGYYRLHWNGTDQLGRQVASGMYIYKLTAGKFSSVNRMLLLK